MAVVNITWGHIYKLKTASVRDFCASIIQELDLKDIVFVESKV